MNFHGSDHVVSYFDGCANGYGMSSQSWPWSWVRSEEFNAVKKMVGEVNGGGLLDLGSGSGYYACRFAKQNIGQVVAVDRSAAMISQIADPRIETHVADAAVIDLGETFEIVLSAGLLEFVENAESVLRNARKHVADKGRMVLLTPRANLPGELYKYFHRRNGLTIHLYDPSELERVASSAGWELLAQKSVFPFALVTAFVPGNSG